MSHSRSHGSLGQSQAKIWYWTRDGPPVQSQASFHRPVLTPLPSQRRATHNPPVSPRNHFSHQACSLNPTLPWLWACSVFLVSEALFLTGKWQLALQKDRGASAHSFPPPLKDLPPHSEGVTGGQDARKAQAEISQTPTSSPRPGASPRQGALPSIRAKGAHSSD